MAPGVGINTDKKIISGKNLADIESCKKWQQLDLEKLDDWKMNSSSVNANKVYLFFFFYKLTHSYLLTYSLSLTLIWSLYIQSPSPALLHRIDKYLFQTELNNNTQQKGIKIVPKSRTRKMSQLRNPRY